MKTVAIASGKGGTGKTTLTTLLADCAAAEASIAIADADVEASNLPLALRVDDVVCGEFLGGAVAFVDPNKCGLCGACERVCRFDAIRAGSGYVYEVDVVTCEGCGACAYFCPAGAIAMVPRSVGSACEGDSVLGPVAFGRLGPGEDLSGRLVTEVRRRAADAAARVGAQFVFVDGPPGIGCPTTAAIAGADLLVAVTEPTVSGAHDLERLVALAARFDLRTVAILNKADLSANGANALRRFCEVRGIPLIAEVPFAPAISRVADELGASVGESRAGRTSEQDAQALRAVAGSWQAIRGRLVD